MAQPWVGTVALRRSDRLIEGRIVWEATPVARGIPISRPEVNC